jgi:hypothetical protein
MKCSLADLFVVNTDTVSVGKNSFVDVFVSEGSVINVNVWHTIIILEFPNAELSFSLVVLDPFLRFSSTLKFVCSTKC